MREVKYVGSSTVRSAGVYVLARGVGENKICPPPRSFTRRTSSSSGRTALPPSQPQAAARDATPPAAASRKKPRRSVDLVMAREPPARLTGEHRPQRGGIDGGPEGPVPQPETHEGPTPPSWPP